MTVCASRRWNRKAVMGRQKQETAINTRNPREIFAFCLIVIFFYILPSYKSLSHPNAATVSSLDCVVAAHVVSGWYHYRCPKRCCGCSVSSSVVRIHVPVAGSSGLYAISWTDHCARGSGDGGRVQNNMATKKQFLQQLSIFGAICWLLP